MNAFILKEISPAHLHVLDNMLQLYVHEINEYFDHTIVLNDEGRYRIKSAQKHLDGGWGYFIVVSCEYAGFILLNHKTKSPKGVFISEFFILPRYRQGFFYQSIIFSLFARLNGNVEYRVLKKNRRALVLFDNIAKKSISDVQRTVEYENGEEYFRFTLDTDNITYVFEKED
jgi:predicted acetyltransferase